jgi:hypothetical protein
MGLFSPPKVKPPKLPKLPPTAIPPTLASAQAAAVGASARARAALAAGAGFSNTVATGPGGAATPTTLAQPTLIGGATLGGTSG